MILGNNDEYLEIKILKRSYENSDNYWDINWLDAEIHIKVSGFEGLYNAFLRIEDFQSFSADLASLLYDQKAKADFHTFEGSLILVCTLQKNGILNCFGEAKNEIGNRLMFSLDIEQENIFRCLKQIKVILDTYPVLMAP
jgi:hypothetical protein